MSDTIDKPLFLHLIEQSQKMSLGDFLQTIQEPIDPVMRLIRFKLYFENTRSSMRYLNDQNLRATVMKLAAQVDELVKEQEKYPALKPFHAITEQQLEDFLATHPVSAALHMYLRECFKLRAYREANPLIISLPA